MLQFILYLSKMIIIILFKEKIVIFGANSFIQIVLVGSDSSHFVIEWRCPRACVHLKVDRPTHVAIRYEL
jgi:hypothetical protein